MSIGGPGGPSGLIMGPGGIPLGTGMPGRNMKRSSEGPGNGRGPPGKRICRGGENLLWGGGDLEGPGPSK